MSKRKVSVSERQARGSTELKSAKVIRFVGVSLAGGKSDKACVAILEYYPENKKYSYHVYSKKLNPTKEFQAIQRSIN